MTSDLQAGWKTMPLEDWMAAIIDYRGKTPEKTSSGIPLVTAKIVKGGRIEDPEEFIAEDAYEQWMRRGIPEAGDVVLTTEAPLGEVAQLDGRKVALAQRIITLRGKPGLLDNTYLKFALQSQPIQEQLHGRASGSTVTGIKQSELRKLQLTFPALAEQQRVAGILGSLDDKIAVNRRISQTLEAMAQAIFKSWFVDFDPVKAKIAAKAEGRDPLRAAMTAISGKPDADLEPCPPTSSPPLPPPQRCFRMNWRTRSWARFRRVGRSTRWGNCWN
ncbi:MAG: restriction endonuclease subunit S [Burkholderiaceae bacterium]